MMPCREWFGYNDAQGERVWDRTFSEASRVALSANPPSLCKPGGALTARQPMTSAENEETYPQSPLSV